MDSRSARYAAHLRRLALAGLCVASVLLFAGSTAALAQDSMLPTEGSPAAARTRIEASLITDLGAQGSVDALVVFAEADLDESLTTFARDDAMSDNPPLEGSTTDAMEGAESEAPEVAGESGAATGAQGVDAYDTWIESRAAAIDRVKNSVDAADIPGIVVLEDYAYLPIQKVRIDRLDAIAALLSHPAVAFIDAERVATSSLAESRKLIGAVTTQASGFSGAGRSVAVLDTGVDFAVADFGPCSAAGVPATPGGDCRVRVAMDFAPNDNQADADGHGTHVAGIVLGVAPRADILALDVFDGTFSKSGDLIAAINWVVKEAGTRNIVAANMSLGDDTHHTATCSSDARSAAFASLRSAGVLPVVAAGNDAVVSGSFQNGVSAPACAPKALSVGAVYDANLGQTAFTSCTDAATAADRIACFSQSASILSVLAPGSSITAAGVTGSGTSMAAPHVAGAVAALAARCPVGADRIEAAIVSSGPEITDSRNGVAKRRLDLVAAATAACDLQPRIVLDPGRPIKGSPVKFTVNAFDPVTGARIDLPVKLVNWSGETTIHPKEPKSTVIDGRTNQPMQVTFKDSRRIVILNKPGGKVIEHRYVPTVNVQPTTLGLIRYRAWGWRFD